MSIDAMVPGTFSSMAAANPVSISATATAAGVSARNCGVPPSPLTGLRLGVDQSKVVRRRRHRGEPVDAGQQTRDPVTGGVVAAQRLDPQLAGAVVHAFGHQPGNGFVVGIEHAAFLGGAAHGDNRDQRTRGNDRCKRVAEQPGRQIVHLGGPFQPGQRGLQPGSIGQLQDQRPAIDVLQGDPRGVQPPIKGIQPGA